MESLLFETRKVWLPTNKKWFHGSFLRIVEMLWSLWIKSKIRWKIHNDNVIYEIVLFAVYYAKVSVEAKHFECANVIRFDWIKNPFTIYYSIQGKIGHHFVFAPIAFTGSWANSNISNLFSLNTNVSERIQDEAKLFASVKWRK